MDAKQFRELLEVAREFKVDNFKIGEIGVQFQLSNFVQGDQEKSLAPASIMDEDELMLRHIENLKSQIPGVKAV